MLNYNRGTIQYNNVIISPTKARIIYIFQIEKLSDKR